MSKVNSSDQSALPDRLTASDVLRLLGGIRRATLTRWMNAGEAIRRGFTRPFPLGVGERGLAKTWGRGEVEQWISDNKTLLDTPASDASRQMASLPLGRVIEAIESATEGAITKQNLAARIERSILDSFRRDSQLEESLQDVKIRGDDVCFDFGADRAALVKFLLRYR